MRFKIFDWGRAQNLVGDQFWIGGGEPKPQLEM